MSIRLRIVDGHALALCAVESDPAPGDVYIAHEFHEALWAKFWRDAYAEGRIADMPPQDPAYESQRVRDDNAEMARWRTEAADIAREICALLPANLAERFRRFYVAG